MATAPVEFYAGVSGLGTLTLKLIARTGTTVAATISLTEGAHPLGYYIGSTAAALVGTYRAEVTNAGGAVLGGGYVAMTDDTTMHSVQGDLPSAAGGDATAANQATILANEDTIISLLNPLIAGNPTFEFQSPVLPGNILVLVPGDDYYQEDNRGAYWTLGGGFADLTGAQIFLSLFGRGPNLLTYFIADGQVVAATGPNQAVRVPIITADQTSLLAGQVGVSYAVWAVLTSGHRIELVDGFGKVQVAAGIGN